MSASPQRETYTLPTAQTTTTSGSPATGLTSGSSQPLREAYQQPTYQTPGDIGAGVGSQGPTVQYICGECAAKVQLTRGDAIRCKDCGHRVLYKERTKRMVQFEAR